CSAASAERTITETDVSPSATRGRAASPGASAPLPANTVIGRYVVIEPIGSGGMGVVYLAFDFALGRRVAVKLVRQRSGAPASGGARLLREARAAAKLSHPNIITVHDVGTFGGQVFIAMEFVEGGTLA